MMQNNQMTNPMTKQQNRNQIGMMPARSYIKTTDERIIITTKYRICKYRK